MLRRLGFVVLMVYGLAILGAALAPRVAAEPRGAVTRHAVTGPAPRAAVLPMAGFAISVHHADDLTPFLRAVDQIHDLGCNSLEVVTPAFQTDGAADQIKVEDAPDRGPSREQLVELLNYAREKGLATTFMPIVLFTDPRDNEWRGKISPEKWDAWWASYRETIDYFLDIAIETGTPNFSVGSELLSTERDVDRWEALIAHVRSRYRGKLFYSTNWDHYTVPLFWKDLDFIGVSGYWDMTTDASKDNPSDPAALAKRWGEIRAGLLAFAQKQGRPLFITEIGYPTLPWALKDPWNYVNSSETKPDAVPQAEGYRAFLAAWRDVLTPRHKVATTAAGASGPDDFFAGCYFYEWDPYRAGGEDDTGYGIRGKPSFEIVKRFLAEQGFTPTTRPGEAGK